MRKLLAAFATSARDRMRYQIDVLGMAVFLLVLLYIFSRLWLAVAEERGDEGRYSVAQLLLYLLVAELVTMSPGNIHLRITEEVKSGEIATQLLRPVGYVPWEIAREAGSAAVRVMVLGSVGIPAVILFTGLPRLDPRGLALGALVLLPLAVIVECAARIGIGLLSFWLEDASPLYWVWQKASFVLGGLMIPLDLYPPWLRTVTSFLPFQALLYGPARTVVAFDGEAAIHSLLALLGWGALLVVLLQATYALSRRAVQVNGG